MPEQSHCRSCGAEIIWCRTVHGYLMPIDANPVSGGNIVIKDGVAITKTGDALFEPMLEGPHYQSHFATCPDAKQHRKKKQ